MPVAAATDAAPAPADGVVRSEVFQFAPGDQLKDTGVLVVTGGRFDRTEAFEVVRTADGGRRVTSVIIGAGDSYRVHARWDYAADASAVLASGRGQYGGNPVGIEISAAAGVATITLTDEDIETVHTAACGADCLLDMAPSALPMFTMTRRYDEARGGPQVFRWVARSLITDQVLLDGSAEIRLLGDFEFVQDGRRSLVKQFVFIETIKNEASGEYFKVAFNLYVSADHRPLAFATASSTLGERAGYKGITSALPKQIPQLRPVAP